MAYKRISPQPVIEGGTGAVTLTGVLTGNGTSAITANAVTQYGTVVAGASNAVSSIAPSATSGIPYISQGNASNPTFGTAVVAGGGTGNTTFTAYSLITAGTTATGAFQNVVGVGTSGQYLISQGPAALPAWTTVTAPGTTITGNTGGALSPTAGNWNIVTANSTVKFAGAVSTETLDFNLNNLVLGSSLPAAAGPQNNVGMGSAAMAATTSAADNVCIGYQAGKAITTGGNSVIVGSQAGLNLTTGTANTAVGNLALSSATTGAANAGSNTALGANTLASLTTGVENDVLGRGAAPSLLTGSYNTILGSSAGATVAGAAYTSSESSNLLISNTGVVGESNKIRIGTSGSGQGQQNACYIAGIDGVNVGSVSKVLTMASDQLGTATITAGTNITVTPTANTITIACTGGTGITFSVITADQTAAVNNGYICNKGTLLTLTLPTTSAVGSIIECTGMNIDLGWKIAQNASQIIHFGTSDTSTGTGGSLASSKKRDSVRMVCVVANLEWNVLSSVGNITIV